MKCCTQLIHRWLGLRRPFAEFDSVSVSCFSVMCYFECRVQSIRESQECFRQPFPGLGNNPCPCSSRVAYSSFPGRDLVSPHSPLLFKKKKKKSPYHGQIFCVGSFSLRLPTSDWYPMGKWGARIGTFSVPTSNLPASCQRLFFAFVLPCLFVPGTTPFLPASLCRASPGKLRVFTEREKWENQK